MPNEQQGDGETILIQVRDGLLKLAHRKRSLILLSGHASAATSVDLAELSALDAAADCFQFVLTIVQEQRARKGTLTVRDLPEWVVKFTNQAKAALIKKEEEES